MDRFILRIITLFLLAILSLSSCDKEEIEYLIEVDDVCSAMDDQVFIDYCLREFDLDHDGKVSMQEAAQVEIIEIRYENELKSLKGLEYFKNLSYITIHEGNIPYLDLSHNLGLSMVEIGNNQITRLNVTKNLALKYLSCPNNQLTNLDISNNKALDVLFCSNNQITKIDVSKNTALSRLWCSSNKLTKLDVSRNPNLNDLSCTNNKLKYLDVSENSLLGTLCCGFQEETITVYYSNGQPVEVWSRKPISYQDQSYFNKNVKWVLK